MNNLEKMKKEELKTLFIEQLNEIQSLMDWSNEEGVPGIFGSLIVDSQYLHDRNLSNPNEYMHKHYKKDNYLSEIKVYQELLDKLKELKKEYENSNFNQINDVVELEKCDSIQNDNEKSNQIQNKRGGKREGAGRKGFGVTKKVSVTLPSEVWGEIEELCEKGNLNQSKVLRELIQKGLLNDRD
ncbi:TPA: ribbon-helix-helix protein, CopG family [Bacillus cereus]